MYLGWYLSQSNKQSQWDHQSCTKELGHVMVMVPENCKFVSLKGGKAIGKGSLCSNA